MRRVPRWLRRPIGLRILMRAYECRPAPLKRVGKGDPARSVIVVPAARGCVRTSLYSRFLLSAMAAAAAAAAGRTSCVWCEEECEGRGESRAERVVTVTQRRDERRAKRSG